MKYVIVLTNKESGRRQAFATLNRMLEEVFVAPADTINNYISRKKVPFENNKYKVEKMKVKRGTLIQK